MCERLKEAETWGGEKGRGQHQTDITRMRRNGGGNEQEQAQGKVFPKLKTKMVESNQGRKMGRLRKTKVRLSNTPQTNWCQEPISLYPSSLLFYSLSLNLSNAIYRSLSDTLSLCLSLPLKKTQGKTVAPCSHSPSLPISALFFLIR